MILSTGKIPKVCFFDSGIGGLTLLHECMRISPAVDYFYFADNFNVPYGSMSASRLIEKTDAVFRQISMLNPSAAVIACNTVTARCADYLRVKYSFPIVGIQPAVKPAANAGRCAVLATPSTADSEALKKLVALYGKQRTEIIPCPDLAAYIENNIFNIDVCKVKSLLPEINEDCIVLGCTHYSFVKKLIANHYSCAVFDGNAGTAEHLRTLLGNYDHKPEKQGKTEFIGGDNAKNRKVLDNIEAIINQFKS